MISAGKLRHRVRLEELIDVVDSNGDVVQDMESGEVLTAWVEVGSYWAAIEPISGREFIQSDATQAQVTTRITLRVPTRIDASMRFVHLAMVEKVYNIHAVLPDKDSNLEYVTCPVSSGVSTTGQ